MSGLRKLLLDDLQGFIYIKKKKKEVTSFILWCAQRVEVRNHNAQFDVLAIGKNCQQNLKPVKRRHWTMNGGTFKGAPVLRRRRTTRLKLPPLACVQLLFQPAFCSDIKVQITFTRWDVAADETTRCRLP